MSGFGSALSRSHRAAIAIEIEQRKWETDQEPCPDCVDDPDELILKPGENAGDLRLVICPTCGSTGLVPHGC